MNFILRTFRERDESGRAESGDTLIEILLSLVIIAITAASILSAFTTAIGASAEETHLAQINTILKSYAEIATAEIQEHSPALFTSCATSYTLTGLPTLPTGYAVTGSPSVPVIGYWNGSSFTQTCPSNSTLPQEISLTATGPANSTGSLTIVVSDFAYAAPTQTSPGFASSTYAYTAGVGSAWTYTILTNKGAPTPAITSSALPVGATFVDNGNGSGTLSGSSTMAAGTYSITFSANNSVGATATTVLTLTVASNPVFTSAPNVSFASGSAVSFTVSATDIDSQSPAMALNTTLSGALKNLVFVDNGNGTGTLSGTLVSGITGTYSLVFEADNSVGAATTQTVTVTVPTVPVFTSATNIAWQSGANVSFTVSATDTDLVAPTLSLTGGLSGAIANLGFVNNGNGTGTLSGTLTNAAGAYLVTLKATNSAGQSATQTLHIEVASLPVFTSSPNMSAKNGAAVNFTISATDTDTAPPSLTLTSALAGACKNLNFVNNGNGTASLSGTLVAGNGTCSITVQASNTAGGTSNQTLTIYIPTAPVFTTPATFAFTAAHSTIVNFVLKATTTSDYQKATFTNSSTLTGSLQNLSFVDNGDGSASLKGTLTAATGVYHLTIVATNSAGVSTSQVFTVTIT